VDLACSSLGIPEHLHTNGRTPVKLDEDAGLYRRFRAEALAFLPDAISFDKASSSVFLESLCKEPSDSLLNDQTGEHRRDLGVARLRVADISETWQTEDGATWEISVMHSPLRCHFAHGDLCFSRNGQPMDKIKPSSIKRKIRDSLRGKISVAVNCPSG